MGLHGAGPSGRPWKGGNLIWDEGIMRFKVQ